MRYLLDTNIVSFLLRKHAAVARRVVSTPLSDLRISVITEAELRYGVAKRPEATRLNRAISEFLVRIDTVAWNSAASSRYGVLRSDTERQGKTLAPLDLLIAAHALSLDAVLVSNDPVFVNVTGLMLEDWTRP